MKTLDYGRRLTQVTATTLTLLLATALPALAQATAEQPPLDAQQLSQAELDSFVAAAERIGQISGELESQAQGIEDEAELARLQEAANQQMVEAVEAEGLSVEEYNRIFQMAQVDTELNTKLRQMLAQ